MSETPSNPADPTLEARLITALRSVQDPEIPVNLYDLGLIYELHLEPAGVVRIVMTLTTPNCPVAESMPQRVKDAAESVEGVQAVTVELVWEPPWTGEMMSEDAKLQLEMMGISWTDPVPKPGPTGLTIRGRRREDTPN